MSIWFPRQRRGIYESIEYIDGFDLTPKQYIKNTEEECDKVCDKLNLEISTEIYKAHKIIRDLSQKHKIDESFLINMLQSQLYESRCRC